jgi:hypothetical protein
MHGVQCRGSALGAAGVLTLAALGMLTPLARGGGQARAPYIAVGSRDENYLRYRSSLDSAVSALWSIRPFTRSQLRELGQADTSTGALTSLLAPTAVQVDRLPVTASLWYNTTFPFGWNDGAVWRGRGATVAASGGVQAEAGRLTVTLDPLLWISENRAFPLMPPDSAEANPYSNPQWATKIDRPQRFGASSYGGFDPGQSSIRVDGFGLTGGLSTENQWIGPMTEWPFVLGNNAAGFPHLFAGSDRPWNVVIGHIHGRLFYGRLSQSAFANTPDTARTRFASGIAGIFAPNFPRGLEIGFVRMFQYVWPTEGLGFGDFRKPFEAFLKEKVQGDPNAPFNDSADNQVASAFARWVFPHSGVEVYGEYGRDDHNWNARDAILEPDHAAVYGLGARKAWKSAEGGLSGLTVEMFSFEPSILSRSGRAQNQVYVHHRVRQGHTERGQNLGVGFAAVDGGGMLVRRDHFAPDGSGQSWSVSRMVVRERVVSPSVDVQYALAGDRVKRFGAIETTTGLTVVYEMNRYFGADAGNVMLTMGFRW